MAVNHTRLTITPYGNGLAANKNVEAGSLLIHIPTAYLLIPEKSALSEICSFCFQPSETLKRCSSCKVPYYCSPVCQKADWKGQGIHNRECYILQKLPDVPPTAVRGLMHILLKHRYGKNMDPEWLTLESHMEDLKKDEKRWDEIVLQARASLGFCQLKDEMMQVALEVMCRMSTNAFRATLPDSTPIGLFFSPIMALANHSCSPNAFIVFDGRQTTLRCLTPIKKDEEIFISYIDSTQLLSQRQPELKGRYFFTCSCEKCSKDESTYQSFLRHQNRNTHTRSSKLSHLCSYKTIIDDATKLTKTSEHDKLCKTPIVIPDPQTRSLFQLKNTLNRDLEPITAAKLYAFPPYPSVLHNVYLQYLSNSSYLACLIISLSLFLTSDLYTYAQSFHPALITRLYTTAKLLKNVASMDEEELRESIAWFGSGAPDVAKVCQDIDFVAAWWVCMVVVMDEGAKAYGGESTFLGGVKGELEEADGALEVMGEKGLKLKKWGSEAGSKDGNKEAQSVWESLSKLAGLLDLVLRN